MNIEQFIQQMRARLLRREDRTRGQIAHKFDVAIAEVARLIERGSGGALNVQRMGIIQRQLEEALRRLAFESVPLIAAEQRAERINAGRDFVGIMQQYDLRAGIDPIAIERIGGATEAGTPLTRLFARLSSTGAEHAAQELFTSVALGENPRLTARRLRKALHVPKHRAETIARTEVLRAYRGSMRERMLEQPEIQQYRWISARSTTTCAMCWAMHGRVFNLGESFSTHPRCRCSQAPIPNTTLVEIVNGEDAFSALPSSTQRFILGPAKHAAYRDGALQLSDLVGTAQSAEWGRVRYERSLREVLGDRARRYTSLARAS